jgi:Xaa-Pro aminopeptidase
LAVTLQPVSREQLCFLLWPDIPETAARRNLTVLLNQLRQTLPANLVRTQRDSIRLDPAGVFVDTVAFTEAGAIAAQRGEIAPLADAVQRYSGPFLHGFALPTSAEFDAWVSQWIKKADAEHRHENAPAQLLQLDRIVDEMRLVKSPQELELMQIAANISAEAHTRAMQTVHPEMMEYALEAELNYIFGKNGCVPSYNSIVGGGANACVLHYVENNKPLKDGDLVLIDAACEYEFYASDITRTFPVNGKFSAEQKALYEVVLAAQYAAIDAVRIGNSYREPHEIAVKILTEGLVNLGLLKGDVNELIETEAYRQFYMHGTGHWLGMDVHDVGSYKKGEDWRQYEEGMVITVEPGLYIAPDDETVDEKWRGIGIRIEDDVVATSKGPRVLTANVVKDIADIEHLMAQAKA